jgi:copper(I)-binding protein
MNRRSALIAALLLGLASAAPALADTSHFMVMKAFARASATPTAKTGAAYVSLMNHAQEADRLVGASSPAAKSAEIHKTEEADGVFKMMPAGPLELGPMATLEMKPGGYHIMLMGLAQPLKKGDEIEVTLTFEKAGDLKVKVPVGEVAAGGHDHGAEGSSAAD